jgi:acetylglutamate kinase
MKKILFKGSGDVTENDRFIADVLEKARGNIAVVICGGRAKINAALQKNGFELAFDHLNRRILKTRKEESIYAAVLSLEAERLREKLPSAIEVIPPMLWAGQVFIPIDGDDLVKAFDLGFDEKYVYTTPDRTKEKWDFFEDYPNVRVITI